MKNHDEFRRAVFEKAEEYKKNKRLKRQKILKIAVSSFACAAIVVVGAMIPIKTFISNNNTAATECTESTTAACTSVVLTTDQEDTASITTEMVTTEMSAASATATTATTSTTVVTTFATSTAATRNENALPDEYYYNGALVLQFSHSCGVNSTEVIEAIATHSIDGLSEKYKKYYDERFFEDNSLIIIKGTTLGTDITPVLAGIQFNEDEITVFLDMPKEFDENSILGAEWQMFIPVSKKLISKDMEIFIDTE